MGHLAHRGALGAILLPKEIFRDPRLVGNERLFLCALFEFTDNQTGKCSVSGETIAELTGIAARNLKPTRKTLIAKGWLNEVSGNTKCCNKYEVTIPTPDGQWNYTFATDKKLSAEGWAGRQEANELKKKMDMLEAKIKRNQWEYFSDVQIIEELAFETELGRTWVPDSALENYAIVRGGDNSDEARESRRARPAKVVLGVKDPFEECWTAEGCAESTGKFSGMSADQLLEYGFRNGAESIDEVTLHRAGLSRAIFPS